MKVLFVIDDRFKKRYYNSISLFVQGLEARYAYNKGVEVYFPASQSNVHFHEEAFLRFLETSSAGPTYPVSIKNPNEPLISAKEKAQRKARINEFRAQWRAEKSEELRALFFCKE